jgi:hypothetical protein
LSYWLYLFNALLTGSSFLSPGGAPDFGWFAYAPLNDSLNSPGVGPNIWIIGLGIGGLGTILGAVNMITTIICLRAPGMTLFRMPTVLGLAMPPSNTVSVGERPTILTVSYDVPLRNSRALCLGGSATGLVR